MAVAPRELRRLEYFPISMLAVSLGLFGFTLLVQKSEPLFRLYTIHLSLLALSTAVFVTTIAVYALKLARHPQAVRREFFHPIKLNFFPILAKVLLIANITVFPYHEPTSFVLWCAGTGLQLLFTILILSMWLRQSHFEIQHLNPSWFIPIVGNIIVPITGIHHAPAEINWFFFSVGLLLWLILLVIVLYRMIFHHPLIEKVIPTLFILFAPPAIGFISYTKLTGVLDPFARILYYGSLFFAMIVFCQVGLFARLRFYLSWWAYSFPTAAIGLASIQMHHLIEIPVFKYLAGLFLGILTIIMLFLIARTVNALRRKRICSEED